ncbi:MAG: hypothetical protein Q9167_006915 [Letrouitia subvulpina]
MRPQLLTFLSSSPLSFTPLRQFTTTLQCPARPSDSALQHRHRNIPPYPHPPRRLYKAANFGLYGLSAPNFGNIVSSRNAIKTRRRWTPNIHYKRLWSASLARFVRVKIQARVLRTIDKCGGLDNYLLGETPGRIKELGMEGWRLRWMVMRTRGMEERFRMERAELGLLVPRGGEGEGVWYSDEVLLGEEELGRKEEEVAVEDEEDQEEAVMVVDEERSDGEFRTEEGGEIREQEVEEREITSGDEEVRGKEFKETRTEDGETKEKAPFWKFWAR